MSHQKKCLISEIKSMANHLDALYNKELNFRNHCYLRIAFDIVVGDKWDTKINKPFVKNASEKQLKNALMLLNSYAIEKQNLQLDNIKSLEYRLKFRLIVKSKNPTLFE